MRTVNVSVIGGGASSLCFLNSLKKLSRGNNSLAFNVKVYDQKGRLGRGNAYDSDVNTNLMNTKVEYLTFDSAKSGDFLAWIEVRKDYLLQKYGMKGLDKDSYVPRSMFGEYLSEKWDEVCQEVTDNFKVFVNNTKVERVLALEGKYVILRQDGDVDFPDCVVMAIGTSHRIVPEYIKNIGPRVATQPYPISKLVREFSDANNIVIIGSRLSAIDAAIALKDKDITGEKKIVMHCIGGTFPTVRGAQGRYKNRYLDCNYIDSNYDNITISDIIHLFSLEKENFELMNKMTCDQEDIASIFNAYPIDSLTDFLKYEIRASELNRPWQAILYDTNSILSLVWQKLDNSDKEYILKDIISRFMGLRVSIPVENAKKILSYLEDGSLTYTSGNFEFGKSDDGSVFFSSESFEDIHGIDGIVFATGSPASVMESDDPLRQSLVTNGILRPDCWGGVFVDENNLANKNLYILGDLTRGRHLFVAAMDIVRDQAEKTAESLFQNARYMYT